MGSARPRGLPTTVWSPHDRGVSPRPSDPELTPLTTRPVGDRRDNNIMGVEHLGCVRQNMVFSTKKQLRFTRLNEINLLVSPHERYGVQGVLTYIRTEGSATLGSDNFTEGRRTNHYRRHLATNVFRLPAMNSFDPVPICENLVLTDRTRVQTSYGFLDAKNIF